MSSSRDPVNLIRLFWIADRNGSPFIPMTTRLVISSLKLIDAKLRADPEANAAVSRYSHLA